jgi:hypothetical protein
MRGLGDQGAENIIENAGGFTNGNQPLSPLEYAGAVATSVLRDTGNAATFGMADKVGSFLGGKAADVREWWNEENQPGIAMTGKNSDVPSITSAPNYKQIPKNNNKNPLPTLPQSPSNMDASATAQQARLYPNTPIQRQENQLLKDGFQEVDNMPGGRDTKSRAAYLGPNNLYMKERLGTPQEYTAALQGQQMGTARGQAMGFQQDPNSGGYKPNDATNVGTLEGGAITEYAIPGKGTATFMGQRQGGGSFSVASGRTPEEQAAIDARVASIDSQTAAMRGLRNANRGEQGRMSVEQEQQMNAMRQQMNRLAPTPDMSGLQSQQQELLKQMQSVSTQKGLTKAQRAAAMEPYQQGLAQLQNQQQLLQGQYGQQLGMAQSLMQNQSTQEREGLRALYERQAAAQAQNNTDRQYTLDVARARQQAIQDGDKTTLEHLDRQIEISKLEEAASRNDPQMKTYWELIGKEPMSSTDRPVDIANRTAFGLEPMPEKAEDRKPGKIYGGSEPGVAIVIGDNGVPTVMSIRAAQKYAREMAMKK